MAKLRTISEGMFEVVYTRRWIQAGAVFFVLVAAGALSALIWGIFTGRAIGSLAGLFLSGCMNGLFAWSLVSEAFFRRVCFVSSRGKVVIQQRNFLRSWEDEYDLADVILVRSVWERRRGELFRRTGVLITLKEAGEIWMPRLKGKKKDRFLDLLRPEIRAMEVKDG